MTTNMNDTSASNSKSKGKQEATALLKADHKLGEQLFDDYEQSNTKSQKKTDS